MGFKVGEFKTGDFVKIREDLIEGEFYKISETIEIVYFVEEMSKYKGKITKIHNIYESGIIKLEIDGGEYHWSDTMLCKFKPSKEDLFNFYLNNKIDKEDYKKLISTL